MTQIKAVSTSKCIWNAACRISQSRISSSDSGKTFSPLHFILMSDFSLNFPDFLTKFLNAFTMQIKLPKIWQSAGALSWLYSSSEPHKCAYSAHLSSVFTRVGSRLRARKGPFRMRAGTLNHLDQKLFQAVWKCHIHKKSIKLPRVLDLSFPKIPLVPFHYTSEYEINWFLNL